MSKTYDMIAGSLNELITDYTDHEGKNLTHDTMIVSLTPAHKFTAIDIKKIRAQNHLTQTLLAQFLCVSKKTVEAWEAGRNVPNGPSCRLLELLQEKHIVVNKSLAIS